MTTGRINQVTILTAVRRSPLESTLGGRSGAEVRSWSPGARRWHLCAPTSEPERLRACAQSHWRVRGRGRIHLPRLNSFDSLSAPAALSRRPFGWGEAGTSAVQEVVTEAPITPRWEDIGVGTPPNVWMELLTNGHQSTDSIRAGRVFDQTEGQPTRRGERVLARSPARPDRRLEHSIARITLAVFGLQVVGRGLAPQRAWSSLKRCSGADAPGVAHRVVSAVECYSCAEYDCEGWLEVRRSERALPPKSRPPPATQTCRRSWGSPGVLLLVAIGVRGSTVRHLVAHCQTRPNRRAATPLCDAVWLPPRYYSWPQHEWATTLRCRRSQLLMS
jgi:hypothetical protein